MIPQERKTIKWVAKFDTEKTGKGKKREKILFVESRILSFGIQNSAHRIRNPANGWNPEL